MFNKHILSRKNFLSWILLLGVLLTPSRAEAQLSINLVAVNASDEKKVVPVKHYLPKELEPEDVLDSGVLKLDYSVDRESYFVYGEFEFQPKETKTFKVKVKDVWQINEEEIEILKNQLSENLALLKANKNFSEIETAKDQLVGQLDYILAQQQSYSDNIGRRIEEYRAYVDQLEDIRKKTFSLDSLETEALSFSETEANKTVAFQIQVSNPSETEEKTVKQKHYLPSEIRSEHVIDKQGFDVRYDNEKKKAYLSKEEKFKPAETKKYRIVIKDVWQLPLSRVQGIQKRSESAFKEIQDSVYAKSGSYLYERIKQKTELIIESQERARGSIKEHIGNHRVNISRFKSAETDLDKLEQMLAIVRAKKLEELEKGKVKNILQKLQALKGLAALSEAIFKKGISVTQTWRIIFGTIIFLAIFTTWHFVTWFRRSKTMGEEQGPKGGEEMKVIKQGEGEGEEEEKEGEG